MEYCEYLEDCKNKNSPKCNNCEYNKNNFEAIEIEENKSSYYKASSKKFYRFKNNYEPE